MGKKFLTILLALSVYFGVACGDGGDKHAHKYEWKNNETFHWEECECGEVKEQVAHAYDTTKVGESTHWSECICGAKANEEVHAFVTKHDENAHWTECSCGYATAEIAHTYAYETSADGHWQKCDCGFIGATVAHDYQTEYNADGHWTECACGAKTEEQAHTLESKQDGDSHWTECACGYVTEKMAHIYAYEKDTNGHWQGCECGYTAKKAAHTYGEDSVCDDCGYAQYLRVDEKGEESATGEYVLFGSYPQGKVTDTLLAEELTGKAGALPSEGNNAGWTSYEYYISGSVSDYTWYQDVVYNGQKYRGVYFTFYRPNYTNYESSEYNTYQIANEYLVESVYWFKYEPLKWKILEEENGRVTLLCEALIDGREYYYSKLEQRIDGQTVYANNYEYSGVRNWLNESFYQTAFGKLEKPIIQTVTLDNSAATTAYANNRYACANTQDKVWLLSYQEALTYLPNAESRGKKTTDYAQCQGVGTGRNPSGNTYGKGNWWLRSPDVNGSFSALYVGSTGSIGDYSAVVRTSNGICPVVQIKLA